MSTLETPLLASENPTPTHRRLADVLVDILVQNGVEVVFGLPGGAIAPLFDALLDRREIRVVTTKHEAGAMFAAAGYARVTGKLGVVLVTSGPGVTNAITGLASAWCEGLPVMLLAGEVPRRVFGKSSLQDGSAYHLDVVGLTRHLSKLALQLHEPNAATGVFRRAIATALSGRRGPVTLTIPFDVSSSMQSSPTDVSLEVSTTFGIDGSALRRAARSLAAKRPVIFAGSGVRTPGGPALLRALAEKSQCPVMTTPKAKGVFPEHHPLSLGVFGRGGHPSAIKYLEGGIDTLLAVGTSLGELETNGWSPLLKPSTEMIHVDIDALQIGRAYQPTVSIAAPFETFAKGVIDLLAPVAAARWFGVQHYTSAQDAPDGKDGRIAPQRALWEIQQVLPHDTIFTCDVGEHSVFATHYLKTQRPESWVFMQGLGSMGQSIGSAIGAQLAFPNRRVAAIIGDGCFAMTCGEVATAVQEELPLAIFVFNDARLGMVEVGHSAIFGRTPSFPTTLDVPRLAEGLGADRLVIEHAGDILRHTEILSARGTRPLVIDVRIDPSARMQKHGRIEALGNVNATARKNEGARS